MKELEGRLNTKNAMFENSGIIENEKKEDKIHVDKRIAKGVRRV